MTKDKAQNTVTIKIGGKRTAVLKTLKKVESLFPLFLEGKEKPNDSDDGIHVFLTVACNDKEA